MSSRSKHHERHESEQSSRHYLRPARDIDWEPYREIITELYHSMTLKEVMSELERQYGLRATTKQWKNRVKIWGLAKNIKSSEYLAMLKKKRQRSQAEPGKRTAFRLRGKEVNTRELLRFERRAVKKQTIDSKSSLSDVASIPDLEVYTPPPEGDDTEYYSDGGDTIEHGHSDRTPAAGSEAGPSNNPSRSYSSGGLGFQVAEGATGGHQGYSVTTSSWPNAPASSSSAQSAAISIESLCSPTDYEWPDSGTYAGRKYHAREADNSGAGGHHRDVDDNDDADDDDDDDDDDAQMDATDYLDTVCSMWDRSMRVER